MFDIKLQTAVHDKSGFRIQHGGHKYTSMR